MATATCLYKRLLFAFAFSTNGKPCWGSFISQPSTPIREHTPTSDILRVLLLLVTKKKLPQGSCCSTLCCKGWLRAWVNNTSLICCLLRTSWKVLPTSELNPQTPTPEISIWRNQQNLKPPPAKYNGCARIASFISLSLIKGRGQL